MLPSNGCRRGRLWEVPLQWRREGVELLTLNQHQSESEVEAASGTENAIWNESDPASDEMDARPSSALAPVRSVHAKGVGLWRSTWRID